MKKTLLVVVMMVMVMVAGGMAQTRVKPRQLTPAGPGPSVQVVKRDGTIAIAQLDGTIVLDESTSPPTLRAVGVGPTTREMWGEAFAPTGPTPSINLSQAPVVGTVRVFLNGLRLTQAIDTYTIADRTITFATANQPQAGDVICVDYRF